MLKANYDRTGCHITCLNWLCLQKLLLNADPTLVLHRGFTYQFSINASGHPFFITSTAGTGAYTVGITNNGASNGTITFTVPMDAPSTLYYYCSVHAAMNGTITIV